jgi:hypothetical protein
MPDTPIADHDHGPYDPVMEMRVSRLEEDMRDVKSSIARLDATTARIEIGLAEIKAMLAATLPHLATKAELTSGLAEQTSRIAEQTGRIADLAVALAEKPSKTYMWGILAVLLTAYACGLAGLAVLR